MFKIFKIAQREYLETVRTRAFLISLLATPLMILVISYFINKNTESAHDGPRPDLHITIADQTGELTVPLQQAFDKENQNHPHRKILVQTLPPEIAAPLEAGTAQLRGGQAQAFVLLEPQLLAGDGKFFFYTYNPKPSQLESLWALEQLIYNTVVDQRYQLNQISSKLLNKLRAVPIERIEIGADAKSQKKTKRNDITGMMIPFFFMLLIYIGIVGLGQQMLTSLLEEKNSRVIEVLLSAVSPRQLMTGKILGLNAIGLTIISFWSIGALYTLHIKGIPFPLTPALAGYFIIFYILGFLLYNAILAGIGSVCSTLKEAQPLLMPLIFVFMLPLISWFKMVQAPDSLYTRTLSLIPPISPMVMILRLSSGAAVPLWQIAAALFFLLISIILVFFASAKIFRTAILLTGKRPTPAQIVHWLRQK